MQRINESKLESDLGYRFKWVTEFIGFDEDDISTITGAAELLAPIVPALVDAVYEKLFEYDATKRHFLPRQHGYTGEVPATLDELTLDHPQVQYRKKHLSEYLVRLVTGPYDARMVKYLDNVGKLHTTEAGNPEIHVPQVQMNALMGFVADAINNVILDLEISGDAKAQAIRSFSKLLWIQNDLINRHYAAASPAKSAPADATASV